MNSQQGPDADISRAVRVLMNASPEFRAALEKTAQKLAEAMAVLDTPEMRKAIENAGAKVAEFEQATRRANTIKAGCDCETCAAGDDSWCCRACHDLARAELEQTRIANGDEPPALEAS